MENVKNTASVMQRVGVATEHHKKIAEKKRKLTDAPKTSGVLSLFSEVEKQESTEEPLTGFRTDPAQLKSMIPSDIHGVLVQKYSKMIIDIASHMSQKYCTMRNESDRLISIESFEKATLNGMFYAVEEFDVESEKKFKSFAPECIAEAIFSTLKVGKKNHDKFLLRLDHLSKKRKKLKTILDRNPTDQEICAYVKISLEDYYRLQIGKLAVFDVESDGLILEEENADGKAKNLIVRNASGELHYTGPTLKARSIAMNLCQGSELKDDMQHHVMEKYAPCILSLAKKLSKKLPPHIRLEDLEMEGYIGLLLAIQQFDIERSTRFKTFAPHRITGSMIDSLRAGDHLSRSVREKIKKVDRARLELEASGIERPSDAVLADHLDMSLDDYYKIQTSKCAVISLDDAGSSDKEDSKNSLHEFLENHAVASPQQIFDRKKASEQLAALIEKMPDQLRYVLSLYYVDHLQFKIIAEALNVTESRVSQLHKEAFELISKQVPHLLPHVLFSH